MRLAPLAGLLLVAAGCASVGPAPAAPTSSTAPPNLILIVTDDHPHDALGCAGHPFLRTPHLDALASRGVRFSHGFVTTPICAASRASLLTGRYERSHGYTFGQPPLAPSLVEASFPSLLRDAGYRVGMVGKLGVRTTQDARARLFDRFESGTLPYLGDGPEPRHLTDRNVDRAIEFVQADDPRPFCLSLWFQAPHADDPNPAQYVWPAAQDGLYEDVPIPEPPTGDAAFFEALPEFLRTGLNRERHGWRFDTPEKRARMVRGYARMLTGVDAGIGRLIAALEASGDADDTVIVMLGDNGYFLGERGYAGKWTMHDRSTRVPFLVIDPRAGQAARVDDALVTNLDVAPTLLDLAGVQAPEGMQGRSLVPRVEDPTISWRDEVFTEHLWDHPRIPRTEGLRTRRWKYVRYLDHPHLELYDLAADPHEARNLAADPAHAEVLAELAARCDRAALGAASD